MKLGFCSILALIFIALKLAGIGIVATWSWVWVLAPIWIPLLVVVVFAIVGAVLISKF